MEQVLQPPKIKKTVLFMGYTCNDYCSFCWQLDRRDHVKDKTSSQIAQEMIAARKEGSTYLELLGGEATIRKDIIGLISFAKELGFETIMMATNGRMFANMEFAKRIVEAGLNHIVFSIHGHNAKLHDAQTRTPGSFDQLVRGLRNIQKLGVKDIGSNSTITKLSYRFMPDIGKTVYDLGIRSSEFIFIDPTHGPPNTKFFSLVPTYEEASPYVNELLGFGKKKQITHWHIRYYPLCFIDEAYHDLVSETQEKEAFETVHLAPDFENRSVAENREAIGRQKVKKCVGCKYNDNCEGYWKVYVEKYGIET